MRIFGFDPGSKHTGYGCIETDGSQHRVVVCGAISPSVRATFPEKLLAIHQGLSGLLTLHRPDCVAIEDLFHARNARSALRLGHVRGVVMLAAAEVGLPVSEYSPTQVKCAVVGYGHAEKQQVQQMVMLLLGLETAPSPLDVSDALAVAVCHAHATGPTGAEADDTRSRADQSWRRHRPVQ